MILLISSHAICFSQVSVVKSSNKYYSEKIRLFIKDKVFKDTVVQFRNYIEGIDDKRIMCIDRFCNKRLEKLIWDCKYISVFLQSQNRLNRLSILSFKKHNKNVIIVSYYLCDRKTRMTIEMQRFKVVNNKITGINIFPGFIKSFTPIEEYEKHTVAPPE